MDLTIFVACFFAFIVCTDSEIKYGNPDEWGDEFEGDIMLPVTARGAFRKGGHWPNGVVPYEFDSNFPKDSVTGVLKALEHYNNVTDGCIKFNERSEEKDYVYFASIKEDCWSYVGKAGGRQELRLAPWCVKVFGSVLHELLHLLGFHHEHTRKDRDEFITIIWENVKKGKEKFFNHSSATTDPEKFYDYESIMHYSKVAYSVNGRRTIDTKDPNYAATIGQRNKLSERDILTLKKIYKCP